MTGYNEQEVIEATNGIKAGIQSYFEATNTELQNQFVTKMSEKWASEDAVTFFKAYEENVRAQFQSDLESLTSIVDHFNSAAVKYASESGATYSPISFDAPACECDVQGINVVFADGGRGIYRTEAELIAESLNTIKENAFSALESIKSAASSSGFYGETMSHQEAINESVENMKNKISNFVEDQLNAFGSAVTATVEKYGNLETEGTNAASGF